jgi:hypothetical protein
VELVLWVASNFGFDLSPFFFPMPFYNFWHAQLMTSHYSIFGTGICDQYG